MHTAFGVVSVVGKCKLARGYVVYILQRDLNANVINFTFNIENIFVHRRECLVVELYERRPPSK